MISAYVLAGELATTHGQYQLAFGRYETLLRSYIAAKQGAAERFAAAFAPRTRFGLSFRNLVIKAFAFPGLAKLAVGRDIADSVELPEYGWPSLISRQSRKRELDSGSEAVSGGAGLSFASRSAFWWPNS